MLTFDTDVINLANELDPDIEEAFVSGIADPAGVVQYAAIKGYEKLVSSVRASARKSSVGTFATLFNASRKYDPVRIGIASFSSGFSAVGNASFSGGSVRYYKDLLGTVVLEGLLRVPSGFGGAAEAFVLPEGYRPYSGYIFLVASETAGYAQIWVQDTGSVAVVGSTGLAGGWVPLDGVRFKASGSAPTYITGGSSVGGGGITPPTGGGGSGSGGFSSITLTGDVTGTSTTETVATVIANNAVTEAKIVDGAVSFAKMASLGAAGLIGRSTAGVPERIAIGSGLTLTGTTLSATAGGGGTLTTVNVVAANGVSGSTTYASTNADITVTLGAITPSSVAAVGAVTGSNIAGGSTVSGTNTGDQYTSIPTSRLIGRLTSGTGAAEVLTLGTGFSNTGTTLNAVGSGGTVTTLSVTANNGITQSVANPTTAPAITLGLGAITPSSVAASGTISGSNHSATGTIGAGATVSAGASVSGSNTGDQTITLSGSVTGSGTSGITTSLSAGAVGTANVTDNAITYAKIQKVTAGKLLGRYSAAPATGDIQELTLGSGLSLDVGTGTITASFSPAIALTGPITGTYSVGTIPTTIADGVVGLNHLANLSPGTLIGRRSGGSASTPEAITLHSSLSMSVGGALSVTNPVTGSNTGDVTLGTANGLSLAGQALSMALATGSVVGTVSLAAQTFAGQKTFSNGILTNTIGAADASTVAFTANVADTGATTAFRFDVSPKLTVAGGKLFDVRNGTSGSLFNIDANNTATFLGPVLSSNMAFSELTAGQLAGRGSAAGPGGAQAISIGAGLTMSGTTLSATNTGTVTAVSVATANGVSGTSSGGATPALTISLGAITPSSVAATGTVSGSNIAATATLTAGASVSGTHSGTSSGSNTGDQAIALTGPITGTWSAGSIATTIAANAVTTTHITDANVTYAKIQNVNVSKVLGRASGGGVGPPEELNVTNGLTVNGNTLELAALTAGRLLGRNTGSAGQPQEVSLAGGLTLNGSAVLSLGTITPVGISFGTIHTPTASTNNTATVNYHKGTATIVAGESQFVLTNSLVTANSFVSVMFESPPCDVNTFAPVSYSVRPDAGSFSISFSNNTDGVSDPSAGNLTFRFFVIE